MNRGRSQPAVFYFKKDPDDKDCDTSSLAGGGSHVRFQRRALGRLGLAHPSGAGSVGD